MTQGTSYKPLAFMDLLELFDITDEENPNPTAESSEKFREIVERKYGEILKYVAASNHGGQLVIKLSVSPTKMPGKVDFHAEVSRKFKKIKNEFELTQDDDGKVYFDSPEQLAMPGVNPVVTAETAEGKKSKK